MAWGCGGGSRASPGGVPWGVGGRALSRPRLSALWAGCRGPCGASGVGRAPTPACSPSRRAAEAGVGRLGSDAPPPPNARPLGGLPGPVWGVRGRALSHPRLFAPWAGCRGRCGASGVGCSPIPDCPPSGRAAGAVWWASGVGRSPTPDCPPSRRAAGAGVGRPGSSTLPTPTARPLGGLPGPVWGVRGRTLSNPRLPALWAGCRGRCGASGVGRSPIPDCSPSGRAAGAGVGRPGSEALLPPSARPLGGLPGPVLGVRGRALSHPRLLALWAGCRGRCGAYGVGRSPTPDCPPSGRAAGAGAGRPGLGPLPAPTARPLGGLPGPVWGVRGRALSRPRLPALWAGCRGRCAASGVGRCPTPDCPPSGRAAGPGVGRPGSGALPTPIARPLGGLTGPVWGVRGRTLSHPRLPALWAGCRGRSGASGVGRSPTPDCSPSGRAAGAGVGSPGSGALPPLTARPLGGLPGPVWGVRGRTLSHPPTARPLGGLQGPVWGIRGPARSHPRLPALWAGCRGRCGASGVGRSPTPNCPPSGRAAGAGVGRPGSGALRPPTARPLGGLLGPVWGVRGRTLSHPRLPALWAGCRGRCWASGVGRSSTPDCSPSGRAAGAFVGRPGSGALPASTARPLGGLPGPVWGVRVGRSRTPDCPPSGRAAGAGVGRWGSGALPSPTARPLGGLPGPVWGVRGRTLSHPRLPALWAGCRGRCWASGVRRSSTPDCSPSGRAAGAGVGRPGSGALPPPTARPLGGLPVPVPGVRGRARSHPQLLALWAGCRGQCGASGVGRSPYPDCSPSGRAAGAGVGRPGSGALPPPTARPLGGLPGPVWGVRGPARSHPQLLALWACCRGQCGASGVGRSPYPDCPPSGRAARAGVGRPGSGALPPPTAHPLGGLPGPVWGVRGPALSQAGLPALWTGCRGRCGASGVGRSPSPTARPLGGLPGPVWGVRGRALSHPRLLALWAGCRGRCGASGVGRSPVLTARPLGGLPGPVWGVRGRTLSHPQLPALWAGCRCRCGASGVRRALIPDCSPSGRAAGAGVGRPGSAALPGRAARPLGGLQGPVWGVRDRTLSHPRLPALWAGCWGWCGASGVGRSPTPDCSPSGRAAGAGVGRPGSDALPLPTARILGGLPGPVWGVWGRALSHPRLPALWAGCRGWCGASGLGRSPTPDCPPSGRTAGAGVGRLGSGALPPPTPRPLGGLPGPVWGVRGRTLSHPQLPALWAGCRCRCGASGVGRAPIPDCSPSGRAAGAGVGRPGSDALPPPTARPLGGLPGPVLGDRGWALSHPPRLALWAGCRGRCGASGVGRSPTPDCPHSGRAAGPGVGRLGSGALPPPTARPLGGLPGPVWGVRGRALSHPRLPALWADCRGRCGASGVGRSPTPDSSPSGRAAGAGVGRPGSDALPPPTARPLGGLPVPVWGVRGGARSHPRLLALWAGCRGRCGASGVGRSPTPNCPPSGRAAGAGVGRPGLGTLPPPTARPLGGLPGPVWGVWGRTLSHSRLPALWAGCRAGVGRPGSGALPPSTARPLGGLPGPVWGVRGRALSHPRLPALWAGCRGRCGASGVGRSPTPDCPPSGRAAGAGVGRPRSGALPPPTARPLGGLPGPVWGVRGRTLSHPRMPALRAGCRGRCGASGVGRRPTPNCPPSGRAAGVGVGRPRSGALPPPTARPLGGLLGPVWGVRGRTLSHPRMPALRAGCRGRCGASGVGRRPTPNCSPFGRAAGLLCVCVPCLAGSGGPASGARFGALHLSFGLSCFALCLFGPLRAGLALFVVVVGFFCLLSHPSPCFFFSPFFPSPPSVRRIVSCFACFPAWGALGLGALLPPPPFLFFFAPPPSLLSLAFLAFRLPLATAPLPLFVFFYFLSCCFSSCCASAVCVLGCRAVCSLSCRFVVLRASSVLFLVAGVVGSWCCCLVLRVCWWLWLPGVVVWWCVSALVPVSGLAVAGRPPCGVPFPCAVSSGAVLPCGAVLWCPVFFFFFLFFSLLVALVSCCSPVVLGSGPVPGRFCLCALPVRCCAGVPAPLLSVRCSLALAGLAGVLCCCLLCLCVCCWAWLSSVVSWWVLVAPGVVSRWRAVVCPWVLCCAVLLRVLPLGVALLCTVLFRFALFGAAAHRAVSWGAVLCLAVLCLLAPCFVLSPRAVCVLLWCVAAWCCSPLCFVPCVPWGVVLCVSCRLRPVRCCCVARSPSVPCFPVLCPVVLYCRVVPWCPVLPPCWVCFLRGCGCTYLKNRCKIL